jgi:hypothetical protein
MIGPGNKGEKVQNTIFMRKHLKFYILEYSGQLFENSRTRISVKKIEYPGTQ